MLRLRQIIEQKLKGSVVESDERYIRAVFTTSGIGGTSIDDAEFFFAPDAARALIKSWGQDEFDRVYKTAWTNFANAASGFFDFTGSEGDTGCLETYDALIAGKVPAKAALYVQN